MSIKLNSCQLTQLSLVAATICVSSVTLAIEAIGHAHRMARPAMTRPVSPLPQLTIPDLLKEINSKQNPRNDGFMNAERATLYGNKLTNHPMYANETVKTEYSYATELLNAGKTDEALAEFTLMEKQYRSGTAEEWKQAAPILLMQKAVAYLRMGESQNCCSSNNAKSCLIPISGAGVHEAGRILAGAIRCLLDVLKLQPDDVSARWLLNIAYMTVGEYPKNVPSKWLIPLNKYGGDYPMKSFYNAAPELGLDLFGWAGSVIMDDFEGNGMLDFVVSSFNINGQLRYIRNNGDGTFTDRTNQSGFAGEVGGLNIITTDFNNDGRTDIIVLRGGWMDTIRAFTRSLLYGTMVVVTSRTLRLRPAF